MRAQTPQRRQQTGCGSLASTLRSAVGRRVSEAEKRGGAPRGVGQRGLSRLGPAEPGSGMPRWLEGGRPGTHPSTHQYPQGHSQQPAPPQAHLCGQQTFIWPALFQVLRS